LDDEVTFAQAATLPVAGLTALRALRLGGSLLGRRILITGATGGVGQFALQLAAASGAEVTAQVRSADRGAMAYQLGASKVVTDLEDAGPFHLILDGVAGPQLPQAVRLLEPGGTLVLYGGGKAPSPIKLGDFYYNGAHNAKIVGFTSTSPEAIKGQDLALLVTLVAQERLLPLIGWTGDWSRTSEALAALANHTFRGKAVLVR
jgi:NADPH:quinone reductase-like Zn-dependent oxidoreductase